jgi:hypothetical protein
MKRQINVSLKGRSCERVWVRWRNNFSCTVAIDETYKSSLFPRFFADDLPTDQKPSILYEGIVKPRRRDT